jgi:membrane-associated protein
MTEEFNSIISLILDYFKNPMSLVKLAGYSGLFAIIFSETGLLIGFFLPGDSLLIAAGLLCQSNDFNLWTLIIILTVAAIIGDSVGFHIGKVLGKRLYTKKDSLFFKKKYILKAHVFYERHGGKTIILARFIPILRTFAPTVAGAARMSYKKFLMYNILGAFLWVWGLVLAGYYLGHSFGSSINNYMHIIILAIILLSISPAIIKFLQISLKKTRSR